MKSVTKRRWGNDELEILKQEYPISLTRDIAKKLNRSDSCVQKMAQMIGLKKTTQALSMIRAVAAKEYPSITRFKQKHGFSTPINGKRNPTYTTWRTMHQRCEYQHHKSYHDYGGRGISVCESWSDFSVFLEDMGIRPKGMTLGRIDNEKSYSPENCRWETYTQQARNRRNTRYIEAFGMRRALCEWSEITGIPEDTLSKRLKTWSVEKALSTPLIKNKANRKMESI